MMKILQLVSITKLVLRMNLIFLDIAFWILYYIFECYITKKEKKERNSIYTHFHVYCSDLYYTELPLKRQRFTEH